MKQPGRINPEMFRFKINFRPLSCLVSLALLGAGLDTSHAHGAALDLSKAVVVVPDKLSKPERKAVQLLVEEVQKRTLIRWEVAHSWPADSVPVIAVGQRAQLKEFASSYEAQVPRNPEGAEGFCLLSSKEGRAAPAVLIVGNDARGVLFGVGRLLRELHMTRGKITVEESLNIATAPKNSIRGHQLGYRPKTNSYDAWTPEIWEQYIRDLAVFGTNAIELIPPRSDDAPDSPHFPLPPMDMMVKMSQIADDCGLDVWIWYPALDADYSKPATVEFALKEWGEVFKKLPRIDAVFVPGGDPGHTQPKHLMALLEKQTENLHRTHPKAQMWVSPQGFSAAWMEEFYQLLQKENTSWLTGIVHGPQVRVSLPELRASIPKRFPIRRYPDITHSRQCQYPVPDWDLSFAMTHAREGINPRPLNQAVIFRAYQDAAIGFLTYSEGCNDDVNKIVWSGLGWDPDAQVVDILRQYSGYFIGDRYRDTFAQGLLALERNWQGPLLTNESVYTTLSQFQKMERAASPQDLLNWRFQQGLYRAYYDAYQRSRLIYETEQEERAMERLRGAKALGSLAAMTQAEAILDQADTKRVSTAWRARVFELAEALFQSIRMQLSVERYKAISVDRGATLDTIDVPLNNRRWLKKRFAELRLLNSEGDRQNGLDEIVRWTDPGPGGFYDDLGNPVRRPHLVLGPGFSRDPASWQSPRVGFSSSPDARLSWRRHAEPLYDAPVLMRYSDLDPHAEYKVRVVYAGDNFRVRIQLTANDKTEIHGFIKKEQPIRPVEFEIPKSATAKGELTLTWRQEPGRGGNGRGCQIAEVWLMKK